MTKDALRRFWTASGFFEAGPDFEPLEVGRWVGEDFVAVGAEDRPNGIWHDPAMRLHVPVNKGEVRRAVMIGTGQVAPGVILQSVYEKAVVECVGMFIEKNKNA